jgi:hypothetical protein
VAKRLPQRSLTIEGLLTSPDGFGLTTATPVQRAICRVSDGLPLAELWKHEEVRAAFGGAQPPEVVPAILVVLAAIRCAKSMIAAARTIVAARTCNLDGLAPGDLIRVPIVSVDKDGADAVFTHVVGAMLNSRQMRRWLRSDPTADSVIVSHESGRDVEIKISALTKAGSTLVGRWLAGCVFDEAPRMAGENDGVKNLDDSLSAVAGRIREGGQIMLIGSPWAPFGPVYELVDKHFGKPSADVVVVRGTGPSLNPVYWTPKRCERLRTSSLASDRRSHQTDVLGEFADAEEALFSNEAILAASRTEPVRKPEPGMHYVAAMDPGSRASAWTLVIVGCTGVKEWGQPVYSVVLAKQWLGSPQMPLQPRNVMRDIAAELVPYGVDLVYTDQFACEALNDIAFEFNVGLHGTHVNAAYRMQCVTAIRDALHESRLELAPDPYLRTDLVRTKKKITQNGVTIHYPQSGDGRHCDYVPALGLAMVNPPPLPVAVADESLDDDPHYAAVMASERARREDGAHVGALKGLMS